VRAALAGFGRFTIFTSQAMFDTVRRRWRWRLILAQCHQIGLKGMPVALLTALFVGMVIVLQTGATLAAFNVKQFVPAGAAKALTREMIPIFVALVIGARTAASIAAELGTMRVTEQIDAMEILGVNPQRYLVVPRVVASTLMLPVMTIYAVVVGLAGGMLIGTLVFHISVDLYLNNTVRYLTLTDVGFGLVKTFFFGLVTGVCGCYHGYHARGGAEGVGRATTSAVVFTLTMIIVLVYFLSQWLMYIEEAMNRPIG
jgi:phospholipid/cholesterol/gamma-HCH transport system permease protein